MNVEHCINEGLLVKGKSDTEKAKMSLQMAEHKIELAEKEFEHEIFENAIISAYTSMFHSARALLFRDGFKERSHFAIFVYVNEKYSSKIERKYINELQALRMQRHELMYGLGKGPEIEESEAGSAIKAAKGFLESVGKMV